MRNFYGLIAVLITLFFMPIGAQAETLIIQTATGDLFDFNIDLAITPEQQIEGLMGRKSLPDNYGMLFVNESAQRVSFWMSDTLVPLDMIFIDEKGRIVKIHHKARPLDETNIPSGVPVLATLEVIGGTAEKLGLKVGDTVHYKIFGNVLEAESPNRYKGHRTSSGR